MSDMQQSSQGQQAVPPASQWRRWHLPVLLLFAIGTAFILLRRGAPVPYQHHEGAVFGTIYHVSYQSRDDLSADIEAALAEVDASLSLFNPGSTLSRVNRGELADVASDTLFTNVFRLAQHVSEATDGAFDITVAPLVNAWGFGSKSGSLPDSTAVDSLLQIVGYRRVRLTEAGRLERDDERVMLDCGAVAKGYGVDVVAALLRRRGVVNYMVEIGGEVAVAGHNAKGHLWHVGVSRPVDDPAGTSQELDTVLQLTDCAMATSGNYRNYRITADGRRIAHTIDPATGQPVQHALLSATVIAPTCAEADAFATSFMVMGEERARRVLEANPHLRAYLITDSAVVRCRM